jgi:hypothetical protein
MKKIMSFLLFAIMALSINATPDNKNLTSAKAVASENSSSAKLTQDEANRLVSRIYEIRDLKKENLSAAEKQNLRNELLSIKSKLSGPVTGVYISGGALILLIILLIILL